MLLVALQLLHGVQTRMAFSIACAILSSEEPTLNNVYLAHHSKLGFEYTVVK